MPHTPQVIIMQPVLETCSSDGFSLWPVASTEAYGFMPLSGALSPEEVGAAVMRIAVCNDVAPEPDGCPPGPADPLGSFLHGLFTMDPLFAAGGLQVMDTATGTELLPGCCNGLDERSDWLEVLDGDGRASFGHGPAPLAERLGDSVRLTVDAEQDDSPVIEMSADELRRLLVGAESDLADFLQLAAVWAARHLSGHATPVSAALARALALPTPVVPPLL
ncbi:hypothetical protein [Streptomyces blastmyceticus]|uniref:Uncharacterized protein n=1 Tax=Streptomyces blastmyceticus TaxID=68180 RepID=A0ABP3HQB4_9ACTN